MTFTPFGISLLLIVVCLSLYFVCYRGHALRLRIPLRLRSGGAMGWAIQVSSVAMITFGKPNPTAPHNPAWLIVELSGVSLAIPRRRHSGKPSSWVGFLKRLASIVVRRILPRISQWLMWLAKYVAIHVEGLSILWPERQLQIHVDIVELKGNHSRPSCEQFPIQHTQWEFQFAIGRLDLISPEACHNSTATTPSSSIQGLKFHMVSKQMTGFQRSIEADCEVEALCLATGQLSALIPVNTTEDPTQNTQADDPKELKLPLWLTWSQRLSLSIGKVVLSTHLRTLSWQLAVDQFTLILAPWLDYQHTIINGCRLQLNTRRISLDVGLEEEHKSSGCLLASIECQLQVRRHRWLTTLNKQIVSGLHEYTMDMTLEIDALLATIEHSLLNHLLTHTPDTSSPPSSRSIPNLIPISVNVILKSPSIHFPSPESRSSRNSPLVLWQRLQLNIQGVYEVESNDAVITSEQRLRKKPRKAGLFRYGRWVRFGRRTRTASIDKSRYRISAQFSMSDMYAGGNDSTKDEGGCIKQDSFCSMALMECKVQTCIATDSLDTFGVQIQVAVTGIKLHVQNAASSTGSVYYWQNNVLQPLRRRKKAPVTHTPSKFIVDQIGVTVNDTSLTYTAVDTACPEQSAPVGYMNNAPRQDVGVDVTVAIQTISVHRQEPDTDSDSKSLLSVTVIEASVQRTLFAPGSPERLQHPIIWLSKLDVQHDGTHGHSVFGKCGVDISVSTYYACLVIGHQLAQILGGDEKPKEASRTDTPRTQSWSCQIARTDIHLRLRNNEQLYLRVDGIGLHHHEAAQFSVETFQVLGISPSDANMWELMIQLEDMDIKPSSQLHEIAIKARQLWVRIPFQYILANLIEEIIHLAKAIKVLHDRLPLDPLQQATMFTYIGPSSRNEPVAIPTLRLSLQEATVQFDDDSFESRLRHIWKTGTEEQAKRAANEEAFENRVKEILSGRPNSVNGSQSTRQTHTPPTRQSSFFGDLLYRLNVRTKDQDQPEDATSESEAQADPAPMSPDELIREAKQRLLEHHATSWIAAIDTMAAQDALYCATLAQDISNSSESTCNGAFSIHVAPWPQYCPLAQWRFEQPTVEFSQPRFPLEQTRAFIHDVGKGVPFETSYALLLPFHLQCSGGQTWIQVRDYPVPLLNVPSAHSGDAWSVSGDYVIADEEGGTFGTRCVPVPLVETQHLQYTIQVTRTASPLKFYSTVHYQIFTHGMSMLCWCVPYQPAIQDILTVLDSLTSPLADVSPRIGFWDKIRLVIHTRTKLSFHNGAFAFVVKGTRDPYTITGAGAGLSKVWQNKAVWCLGYNNPEREFMQIRSKDYAFGAPNLLGGGYIHEPMMQILLSSKPWQGVDPTLLEQLRCFPSRAQLFEKTIIKLSGDVCMGIGWHLERKVSDTSSNTTSSVAPSLRSMQFMPHYRVLYKAAHHPDVVNNPNYDAFAGFRSNYVHLSFSIIKLPDDQDQCAISAIYLTPKALEHFTAWGRLFGGALGLPVREGPLFPKQDSRPSPRLGKLMSSIKYKISVHPVMLSFVIKDQGVDHSVYDLGDAVGLKVAASHFIADFHQEREIVNVSDLKLQQRRIKANWPTTEAEVSLEHVDIRALRATYESASDVTSLHSPSFASEHEDVFVDIDDFVDFGVVLPREVPTVKAYPFCSSPCVHYRKQSDRPVTAQQQLLWDTHQCILGKGTDTYTTQLNIILQRKKDIKEQIQALDDRIALLEEELERQPHDMTVLHEMHYLQDQRSFLSTDVLRLEDQYQMMLQQPVQVNDAAHSDTFMERHIVVHNPRIVWNNNTRNIIYQLMNLNTRHKVLSFDLSTRAIKLFQDMMKKQPNQDTEHETECVEEAGSEIHAQAFIDQLLADTHTEQFIAPNEDQLQHNNLLEFSSGDNEDDKAKQIPSIYTKKLSVLVDLLHPQVCLQSEQDPDHCILAVSESMCCKNYNIVDPDDPDAQMEVIQQQTVLDVQEARLFVTRTSHAGWDTATIWSRHFKDPLEGQLSWMPLEDLIQDAGVLASTGFRYIGRVIGGTIQYDRYNRLRVQTMSSDAPLLSSSPSALFEENHDTVYIRFSKLTLNANAETYRTARDIATDLILSIEPSTKEQQDQLQEMAFTIYSQSVEEIKELVRQLQTKARKLLQIHDRHYHLHRLRWSTQEINQELTADEEYIRIRQDMQDNLDELYLMMEAVKSTHPNLQTADEPKTSFQLEFLAKQLEWVMLTPTDRPLCRWSLSNVCYVLARKADNSTSNTVEVDMMEVADLAPNPTFYEVLGPYYTAPGVDFTRQKMVRGNLVSLAPVGGIPIIRHLEVNLYPLRIQMTHAMATALVSYLFNKTPPAGPAPLQVYSATNPSPSSSSSSNVSSVSVSCASQANAVEHNASLSLAVWSSREGPREISINQTKRRQRGLSLDSGIRRIRQVLRATRIEAKQQRLAHKANAQQRRASFGRRRARSIVSDEAVWLMKKRAQENRSFILVKIPGVRHCLSYQGPKPKNIEDLRDFVFHQPSIEYRNYTCTWYDLYEKIKKDFWHAIFRHSGALLKEKLTMRREPSTSSTNLPASLASQDDAWNTPITSHMSLTTHDLLTLFATAEETSSSSECEYSSEEEQRLEDDVQSLRSSISDDSLEAPNQISQPLSRWRRGKSSPKRTRPRLPFFASSENTGESNNLDFSWDDETLAKARMLLGKAYGGPLHDRNDTLTE